MVNWWSTVQAMLRWHDTALMHCNNFLPAFLDRNIHPLTGTPRRHNQAVASFVVRLIVTSISMNGAFLGPFFQIHIVVVREFEFSRG